MKLREEDLSLAARKALLKRLLRTRADNGAVGQHEYLAMQGRIEKAENRAELDALQAEVERMGL
ncbi:MAG: hypothetical protein QHJ73_11630 [Armatimonadota bacterium]|nr:hypothetical protein [Armatimonadota bacterium]